MPVLDSPEIYARLDPTDFHGRVASLPASCRRGWLQGSAFPMSNGHGPYRRILYVGMGGSAIAGQLLADLMDCEGGIPVDVHQGYGPMVPASPDTLLIASSYSGDTEETLSALRRAWRPGVTTLAITRGGELAEACARLRIPVLAMDVEGEPRTSCGFAFFALLAALQKLGLTRDLSWDVQDATTEMDRLLPELDPAWPARSNPAKSLAMAAEGKVMVVCAAQHLAAVSSRWKSQMAENAKALAFCELLPAMNHTSIEGIGHPAAAVDNLLFVMLRSGLFDFRVNLRCALTMDLLSRTGVSWAAHEARGRSPLAQIASTVLFGDYVSYYVALLNGVDPSSTPNIQGFKRAMTALSGRRRAEGVPSVSSR